MVTKILGLAEKSLGATVEKKKFSGCGAEKKGKENGEIGFSQWTNQVLTGKGETTSR